MNTEMLPGRRHVCLPAIVGAAIFIYRREIKEEIKVTVYYSSMALKNA